jgi:hypothetical protein
MDQQNRHPQDIDITIKNIILPLLESKLMKDIMGIKYKRELDSVFKTTKERRVDLLLELEDDSILHIEFQTTNDNTMLYRMFEYYSLIKMEYKEKTIHQKLIYLGEDKCNMKNTLKDSKLYYEYELIDLKDFQCDDLLESDNMADITFAFLCNVRNREKLFRKALSKLRELPEQERSDWIGKILTLLKVRPKLREGFKMLLKEEPMLEIPPFTIEELKDLPFIAKAIEQLEQEAILKGKKEGLQEGLEKGKQEGSLKTKKDDIKSVILIKFGVLPKELEEKIETTDDIQILDDMLKKVALAGKIEEIL